MFEDFYLNIKLMHQDAKIPTRANSNDAGLDLFTPIDFVIKPNSDELISLGFCIEMSDNYVMIIKEKSGVATNKKLDIGACVIDSSYRGLCHVHLFNNSDKYVVFNKGDKIAQAIIIPCWIGIPKEVKEINMNTERGTGGFGSSDKK